MRSHCWLLCWAPRSPNQACQMMAAMIRSPVRGFPSWAANDGSHGREPHGFPSSAAFILQLCHLIFWKETKSFKCWVFYPNQEYWHKNLVINNFRQKGFDQIWLWFQTYKNSLKASHKEVQYPDRDAAIYIPSTVSWAIAVAPLKSRERPRWLLVFHVLLDHWLRESESQ